MNQRRETFCEAYMVSGNATQAAKDAGYSDKTAYSTGQRLLKNVEVIQYISGRRDALQSERVAQLEEVREFWTDTMRSEEHKVTDRLKASELLGKTYGAFLDRVEMDVNAHLSKELQNLTTEELRRLAECVEQ